jgi:hypothetical protein
LLPAVAGPVSILNAIAFFRANARSENRLPGTGSAIAGIVLSSLGMIGIFVRLALWPLSR